MRSIRTENEQETIDFAKKLTQKLTPGMTLLLEGDLGAGKTTFTKGVGKGLDIQRIVKSPTYTIIREYQEGKYPLYHIDLYRLGEDEVFELGLEEYFEGEGISVVEWPSIAPAALPAEHLHISLAVDATKPEQRIIQLKPAGEQYEKLVAELRD